MKVAFEIDGIDPANRQGWSVLVRGTLHHVDPDAADFRERFDPEPWILADRDAWLIVEPFVITGRRLHPATREWAFHMDAYLESVDEPDVYPAWESNAVPRSSVVGAELFLT